MGDRRCCCDCVQWTDIFGRDAASTLGDNWIYHGAGEAGTRGAPNWDAYITSGVAYFNFPLPDSAFVATFNFITPQDNDIIEFCVTDDPTTADCDDFFRFEVEDTVTNKWIQSIHGSAGSLYDDDELIAGAGTYQDAFSSSREFLVSFDRAVLRISSTTPEWPHYELWDCSTTATNNPYFGIRHGGGPNTLYFDTFFISDHYVHNRICPHYGCVCGLADPND